MQIITNNIPRPIIYGHELSDKERGEHDYLRGDDLEQATFARYNGRVYYLADFMRVPNDPQFDKWQGVHGESFFSGVLMRYSDCGDAVTMGRYYS